MKVAYDENMPSGLADTFEGLAKIKKIQHARHGLEFSQAKEYVPNLSSRNFIRGSDVPWLDSFAAKGGRAIISGDGKMRQRPHELQTLLHHEFIVIFFEPSWNNWDFYKKVSLMIHWWPIICLKIKTADRGTHWVVPNRWPYRSDDDYGLKNVSTGLKQLLKDRSLDGRKQSVNLTKIKPKLPKGPRPSKTPAEQGAFQYEDKQDDHDDQISG